MCGCERGYSPWFKNADIMCCAVFYVQQCPTMISTSKNVRHQTNPTPCAMPFVPSMPIDSSFTIDQANPEIDADDCVTCCSLRSYPPSFPHPPPPTALHRCEACSNLTMACMVMSMPPALYYHYCGSATPHSHLSTLCTLVPPFLEQRGGEWDGQLIPC